MSNAIVYPTTVISVTYIPGESATAAAMTSSAASSPSSSSASGNGTASAASEGAAAPTGMPTDERIVFWLDIVLLCTAALFFLIALPRILARFSRSSKWKRGFLLYGERRSSVMEGRGIDLKRSISSPRVEIATATLGGGGDGGGERIRRQWTDIPLAEDASDQSHTLAPHGGAHSLEKPGRTNAAPPHVRGPSSLFYPLSSIFAYEVSPGKSVGKLSMAFVFVAAVITLLFVLDGNPLTDPERPGWIATGLIPVTIAFATKNNLVGMLVGRGYERLNFIHRWIGIVSFVAANLHAIGYIYKWAIKESLAENFRKPFIIHGTIALVGIEILYITSLGWVRQKAYTFFLSAHVVGYLLLLVALCFHDKACIKWVILAVGIYGLDHFLRLIKTRICIARLKAVPELGMTRLEIPSLISGWRAGQHIRLRVLSIEMGVVGWSVAHPFTIANASRSDVAGGRGMMLLVKKAGNWTGALYDAASRAGYIPRESGYGTVREMSVIVEGPYGGLGNMMIESFSTAMLVGGGSGVTFVLSQAEELIQAVHAGRSSLQFIEIIWITQDQAALTPLLPTFSALLSTASALPGVLINICIFYSRASTKASESSTAAYISSLAPALSVHAGRPTLPRILDGLVRRASELGREKSRRRGVAVCVCGPLSLVQDVRKAADEVDGPSRNACGGVEVHEEVFGW